MTQRNVFFVLFRLEHIERATQLLIVSCLEYEIFSNFNWNNATWSFFGKKIIIIDDGKSNTFYSRTWVYCRHIRLLFYRGNFLFPVQSNTSPLCMLLFFPWGMRYIFKSNGKHQKFHSFYFTLSALTHAQRFFFFYYYGYYRLLSSPFTSILHTISLISTYNPIFRLNSYKQIDGCLLLFVVICEVDGNKERQSPDMRKKSCEDLRRGKGTRLNETRVQTVGDERTASNWYDHFGVVSTQLCVRCVFAFCVQLCCGALCLPLCTTNSSNGV